MPALKHQPSALRLVPRDFAVTWGARPMNAARIGRLTLTNFRSYHAASLTAGGGPIVLVGPNGAGKTNLIEAISFLSPGRGLRRATLEEVAFAEGDGSWAVAAEVDGRLGLATLGTGIVPAGRATAKATIASAASIASRSPRPPLSPTISASCGSPRRWTVCSRALPPSAGGF